MKFFSLILTLAILTASEARHVSKRSSDNEPADEKLLGYLVAITGRQGLPVTENTAPEIIALKDSSNGQQDPVEGRGPFDDFVPYVSNFVYRDSVKRWLVKPMIKGSKRLFPPSALTYYKTNLANRRFFRMLSPIYPALTSYTSKKFEQGVFWTLNRGYTLVRDNLFEFDE